MKKIVLIVMSLLLMTGVAGCSSDDEPNPFVGKWLEVTEGYIWPSGVADTFPTSHEENVYEFFANDKLKISSKKFDQVLYYKYTFDEGKLVTKDPDITDMYYYSFSEDGDTLTLKLYDYISETIQFVMRDNYIKLKRIY